MQKIVLQSFSAASFQQKQMAIGGRSEPNHAGRCLMTITKPGQPPPSNDPLTRARCRAIARVIVAHELGLEPECVRSRSDGHPYLVLKVPESLPVEKRVQDWLTVYHGGVEAEKQVYGSYTGDGSGEIEDLGHEFHLEKRL